MHKIKAKKTLAQRCISFPNQKPSLAARHRLRVWLFLANFSGVIQLKNIQLGLSDSQENAYLVVRKMGMTRTYTNKNEEQPGGFAVRIFKV